MPCLVKGEKKIPMVTDEEKGITEVRVIIMYIYIINFHKTFLPRPYASIFLRFAGSDAGIIQSTLPRHG